MPSFPHLSAEAHSPAQPASLPHGDLGGTQEVTVLKSRPFAALRVVYYYEGFPVPSTFLP